MLGASPALAECGRASWYELTGRTASGARANPEALTAAHRKLPFGTKVLIAEVRDEANADVVVARAFERLTKAVIRQLIDLGVTEVKVIDIKDDVSVGTSAWTSMSSTSKKKDFKIIF